MEIRATVSFFSVCLMQLQALGRVICGDWTRLQFNLNEIKCHTMGKNSRKWKRLKDSHLCLYLWI